MNDTIRTLLNRKSIRDFAPRPVPQELRDEVFAATLRAPTAGNMMLYSIIEVSDPALKERLSETCDRQRFIATAPWVLVFLADYRRWMDLFAATGVEGMCSALGKAMQSPREGDLVLALCDTLIAAQTAVVAAESFGLGACYIGDILEHAEEHRELLGLPRYVFPVTLICLGYPTDRSLSLPLKPRFDRRHIVFENRYRSCDAEDFDDMAKEAGGLGMRYREGAANFGQHLYLKKFVADFTAELRRSVRTLLDDWS